MKLLRFVLHKLRFVLHKVWGSDAAQDLTHLLLLPIVVVGIIIIGLRERCRAIVREYRAFNPGSSTWI